MNSYRSTQNLQERDYRESISMTGRPSSHEKVPIKCYPVHADDVRESLKLAFEAVKHLTTLSAGSFVLIATFLKDIFPKELARGDKILVGSAFLCFAVSLVFSAFSMWRLSTLMRSRREYPKKKRKIRWNIVNPSIFYILGLTFFGTAVLANVFYGGSGVQDVLYVPLVEVPVVLFVPVTAFILAMASWFAARMAVGRRRDKVYYRVLYPTSGELGELPSEELLGNTDVDSPDESG